MDLGFVEESSADREGTEEGRGPGAVQCQTRRMHNREALKLRCAIQLCCCLHRLHLLHGGAFVEDILRRVQFPQRQFPPAGLSGLVRRGPSTLSSQTNTSTSDTRGGAGVMLRMSNHAGHASARRTMDSVLLEVIVHRCMEIALGHSDSRDQHSRRGNLTLLLCCRIGPCVDCTPAGTPTPQHPRRRDAFYPPYGALDCQLLVFLG